MKRQRGYSLIEVIVAFALLALALTLLLGTLSGASRQVRRADDAGRATLHAQSLLATVGTGEVLKPGSRQGEFDDGRYRWSLQVEPWSDPTLVGRPVAPSANRLLELVLTVQWGDGAPRDRVELRTLRLVPADATGGGVG